jgi:hypothetical protein
MATLRVFVKPRGFVLPDRYTKLQNAEGNISFINPQTSELDGYTKYTLGRFFEKSIKVMRPTNTGVVEEDITKPTSMYCFIYVPTERTNNRVFMVGYNSDKLLSDMLSFTESASISTEGLDMEILERRTFTSGIINLMGHRYSDVNRTISYTVRKIDGVPFRRQDPNFVSCDEAPKEALEVSLHINGDENPASFYVYSDGKITRRGISEAESSDFDLLITVYNILQQVLHQ